MNEDHNQHDNGHNPNRDGLGNDDLLSDNPASPNNPKNRRANNEDNARNPPNKNEINNGNQDVDGDDLLGGELESSSDAGNFQIFIYLFLLYTYA